MEWKRVFRELRAVDDLRVLAVDWTTEFLVFDDETMELVSRLTQLEDLSLHLGTSCGIDDTRLRCGITEAGWSQLGRLTRLRRLDLSRSDGGESLLDSIERLPHLETLVLDHLAVHDDDLEPLRRMPSLREVGLTGTFVTDTGIQRLAETVPNLTISDD